jgi:uncharacterized protein (TIGR00156 family)
MRNKLIVSSLFLALALVSSANARNLGGGFEGPGVDSVTVSDVQKMADDTHVVIEGFIEKGLGNEEYLFKDNTGSIVIEVDDDDWRGLVIKPENKVVIKGEIDKEMFREPKIDVDSISLK